MQLSPNSLFKGPVLHYSDYHIDPDAEQEYVVPRGHAINPPYDAERRSIKVEVISRQ
jgi:hypothetical protein